MEIANWIPFEVCSFARLYLLILVEAHLYGTLALAFEEF